MTSPRTWWAAARWPTTARRLGLDAQIRWLHCHDVRNGVSLSLHLTKGSTAHDVAASVERLRSSYRCAIVEVAADPMRGDRATVSLRWAAHPIPERYASLASPGGVVPPRATEPLPLGTDLDGRVVSVELFDPIVGGSSLLVGGVPGSGKTTALRVILAGLSRTPVTMVVIDPTGGAEAMNWSARLSTVVSDAEPAPAAELLNRLLRIIEQRGVLVSAGVVPGALHPIVLVCDEVAELGAAGTARQQDDVRSLLRRVTALGRKANVAVVLATQRTTASSIDVTTRSLVASRLALAHPGDRYGSEALLGPGRYEAADLPKAARGLGYLSDGGHPQLLQVLGLDVAEVPSHVWPGLRRELDEVEAWDDVLRRELS